jgi:hypothetical protein
MKLAARRDWPASIMAMRSRSNAARVVIHGAARHGFTTA